MPKKYVVGCQVAAHGQARAQKLSSDGSGSEAAARSL